MFIFLNYRQCEKKLVKACMVDYDYVMGAISFELEIYLCPLDTYCKPFGDTGLSAVLG